MYKCFGRKKQQQLGQTLIKIHCPPPFLLSPVEYIASHFHGSFQCHQFCKNVKVQIQIIVLFYVYNTCKCVFTLLNVLTF